MCGLPLPGIPGGGLTASALPIALSAERSADAAILSRLRRVVIQRSAQPHPDITAWIVPPVRKRHAGNLPSCLVKPEFRDGLLIPICRCEAVTKLPGARQAEMLGRVSVSVPPLRTARLSLEPLTATLARAILAGDLSGLSAAPDWPHEHTAAGLAHAVHDGYAPGWLITTAGQVIGDGGTHGGPDERGCVEIGYGLAAPYRGQGLGSEAVMAMTAWLIAQPDIARVRAYTAAGNTASRRVLEKAGYRLAAHDQGQCVYEHP